MTTTEHFVEPGGTEVDEVCDGETAPITFSDSKVVIHTTEFDDGRYHVTGTFRGGFRWTQDGVTYTGHYTGWFGENQNAKSFNLRSAGRARLSGEFRQSGRALRA